MALSCDTGGIDDPSSYSSIWEFPQGFTKTPIGRRKRCRSCGDLIPIASDAVAFPRWRVPLSEVEYRIYGDDGEIPLASHWHCENCGGLALSLIEHGYSIDKDDDMRVLVKEHAALVRIVGDAPCKNRLLEHDLSIVEGGDWSCSREIVATQVIPRERILREAGQHRWQQRHPRDDREVFSITFACPSFAAFEAQWQMMQRAHPLIATCEWRLKARPIWTEGAVSVGVTVFETAEAGATRLVAMAEGVG